VISSLTANVRTFRSMRRAAVERPQYPLSYGPPWPPLFEVPALSKVGCLSDAAREGREPRRMCSFRLIDAEPVAAHKRSRRPNSSPRRWPVFEARERHSGVRILYVNLTNKGRERSVDLLRPERTRDTSSVARVVKRPQATRLPMLPRYPVYLRAVDGDGPRFRSLFLET
jgi:hypothetical protein